MQYGLDMYLISETLQFLTMMIEDQDRTKLEYLWASWRMYSCGIPQASCQVGSVCAHMSTCTCYQYGSH